MRTALVLSAALLLGPAFSGCRPVDQAKEKALYRDVLDGRVPPPPPYAPDQPLTLRHAMALANGSSEQLASSGESYVQALINKQRLVSAFLPTLSFQPSFTVEERPEGGASGTGTSTGSGDSSGNFSSSFRTVGDTQQRFEAPVVGNMNLFRGGGDVANLAAARARIAQSRELLLDLQNTVLLNVAQVYFQVLRSERAVQVTTNTLRLQEARLADVEQQFKNGLATRLSVAQTRAQVNATRVLLVQAQSDVRNGRSTLALLIGEPSVTGPLVDDLALPPERPTRQSFEEQAVALRQDLRAARAAVEAARHAVDAAIAQYYPSVSLNVAGFLYRENFSDASRWNAILSAYVPIFSAGVVEQDVRLAWSRLRQAALAESGTRRQILHDVQVAYENLVTAERRIQELREEVASAEEAFQQARNAFNNSLATNLDVLAAQDQLLNAELQLAGAGYDRAVFYLDLVRSTGELDRFAANVAGFTAATTQPTTFPTTLPATAPATAPE